MHIFTAEKASAIVSIVGNLQVILHVVGTLAKGVYSNVNQKT